MSGIDDLQGALAAHAANALFLCCQDAAIGRSGDDAIIAIAHAYRDFIHYHHGTYTATLHPQHTENPALVQANQALMQLLARVLGTTHITPLRPQRIARTRRSHPDHRHHQGLTRTQPASAHGADAGFLCFKHVLFVSVCQCRRLWRSSR